jgi:hypothetical protein
MCSRNWLPRRSDVVEQLGGDTTDQSSSYSCPRGSEEKRRSEELKEMETVG